MLADQDHKAKYTSYETTYPKTSGKRPKRLKKTKNDYFSSALALLPVKLDLCPAQKHQEENLRG